MRTPTIATITLLHVIGLLVGGLAVALLLAAVGIVLLLATVRVVLAIAALRVVVVRVLSNSEESQHMEFLRLGDAPGKGVAFQNIRS